MDFFKLKRNQEGPTDKYKARLVARRCEQRRGIDFDEVFTPKYAKYETIRTLFSTS